MSKKSQHEILKERETRYRDMARDAERLAEMSQDIYVRTVYFSLAEGWLGIAERITVELNNNAPARKEQHAKSEKSLVSIGGMA